MINSYTSDGVLTLTLTRPTKRNAMNAELVAQLLVQLSQAESNSGVGVILLIGAGAGFCAGSDLSELAQMDSAAQAAFERDSGLAARRLLESSKPVVAAVHGFAIGGGLTLATSCDVVVTEPSARWSLPEVPIGLFPAWGLASVTSRVGVANARRLSFGIDTWDGAEAVRLGLADILTHGDVPHAAREIAVKLARLPSAQSAAVKSYFADTMFENADRRANETFIQMSKSAEAQTLFEEFRNKARRQKS